MTEHRNRLAQLDHEQLQAKLIPPQELINSPDLDDCKQKCDNNNQSKLLQSLNVKMKLLQGDDDNFISPNSRKATEQTADDGDDPHHLSQLKLLDKRLADSFSKVLNMSDQQKSSIVAKHQTNQPRPSIFQVLLGKSNKINNNNNNSVTNKMAAKRRQHDEAEKPIDNRVLIDDINRQTRLAMQYSKQLEANLLKVEDLRAKYEMHLKMGLVVKSVSRAYLTCSNSSSSMANSSPNSLARQRQRCTSSLMVNDSSSIGTHSSLSSLNLSNWSFSRSRRRERNDSQQQQQQPDPRLLAGQRQGYVSTISLDSTSKRRSKHLNLSKLISSSSSSSSAKQQQQDHAGYSTSRRPSQPHLMFSNELPNHHRLSQYAYGEWTPTSIHEPQHQIVYHDFRNDTSKSGASLTKSPSHSSLKRIRSRSQLPSNHISYSKTTIKDFIENIDRIEAEFESFMGSFLLTIEDIQGFARVCQGDVFGITIKYGDSQKFKTKISVLKDNKQKCDNRQAIFKARIADVLAIKAHECKGLGKKVLLGHKLCETRDFFTARSQLMTISLNQTGSIKLNMVITWNPLHLAPNSSLAVPGLDISHISLPPAPVSSSTLSSLSSVPSMNGTTTTINIQSNNRTKSLHSPQACGNIVADSHQQQDSTPYYDVDPTYGYYIPEPDYVRNDYKY